MTGVQTCALPICVNAIVAAILWHDNDVVVQREGCSAIMHLTKTLEGSQMETFPTRAIRAIVAALSLQITDHEVQQYACGALMNLARNHEANQSEIARAGGIPAIVAAMNSHTTISDVQQYACGMLSSPTSANNPASLLHFFSCTFDIRIVCIITGHIKVSTHVLPIDRKSVV